MNTSRIWVLNLVCAAVLVWGVASLRAEWKDFDSSHQVSFLEAKPDRAAAAAPAAAAPVATVSEAWTDILSRNPFSFDRNDINIVPVVIETPKVTPPKPLLFGVVDLGSGRKAMLGDPGARRSSKAVTVGEKFRDWTVVKIEPRSIVVELDGEEETVELGNAPVDRDGGKTASVAAAAVTTTTSTASVAPATPPSPQSPVAPAIGLPPGTQVVAPPGTRVTQTPFGPVVEQLP